jgi:hypothetical protein
MLAADHRGRTTWRIAVHRPADLEPADEPTFETAEPLLLRLLAEDLEEGRGLAPSLLAFAGERPLGLVRLRPHGTGEAVQALLEILALLLPLGADRIVLVLPGRVWSSEDPIPPVTAEADLRQPVVVAVVADAHPGPCCVGVRLHPFDIDDRGRCSWQPAVEPDGTLEAPVVAALQVLLDHGDDVRRTAESGAQLAAQFGRVLLLGHEVSLAAPVAGTLLTASAGGGR